MAELELTARKGGKTMQTGEQPILRETLEEIAEILGPELDGLTVERAVIGLFFTGVKLSNGVAGACATPIKTIPEAVCCPTSGDGHAVSRQAAWPPVARPRQGSARRSRHSPRRRHRGGERPGGYLLAPPSASRDRAAPRHRRVRCDRDTPWR